MPGPPSAPTAPDHDIDEKRPLIFDLDANLVTAQFRKGIRCADLQARLRVLPLCAFVDHGQGGTGEPVAMLLRPDNAGSNTAADHLTVVAEALTQLPLDPSYRVGKKVLVRIDGPAAVMICSIT